MTMQADPNDLTGLSSEAVVQLAMDLIRERAATRAALLGYGSDDSIPHAAAVAVSAHRNVLESLALAEKIVMTRAISRRSD